MHPEYKNKMKSILFVVELKASGELALRATGRDRDGTVVESGRVDMRPS